MPKRQGSGETRETEPMLTLFFRQITAIWMPCVGDDYYAISSTMQLQRSMRTSSNVATVKIDISDMADGQFAGLTHFSTTNHSLFGIKQENGIRSLLYSDNGKDTSGIKVNGKTIWLRSTWDANGISHYVFSTNGKSYQPFGSTYQLTWGSYRGDRIGIFNFNTKENKGYIDVDWFRYDYGK